MSQYITRDDCRDVEDWTGVVITGPDRKSILAGNVEITVPLDVVTATNWATETIVPHGFTIFMYRPTTAPSMLWKQRWSAALLEVIGNCYHSATRNQVEAQNWSSRAASFSQSERIRDDAEAQRSWKQCQQMAQIAVFYIRLADVLRAELEYANKAIINDAEDLRMLAKLNVGGVL